MKKMMIWLVLAAMLLSACAVPKTESENIYEVSYLNLFDTLTVIKGAADSQAAFEETARSIYEELEYYNRLFDIYNDYEGLNNLKTVNDMAGVGPVQVDQAVIDLLKDCCSYYELSGGKVNVAMGSVLKLWHDARTEGLKDPSQAKLPDMDALEEAAAHCSFDSIVIDEEASTVCITDAYTRLDVGAIAKGWATQRVVEKAPANMLISVGGNVCATGPKDLTGTPWVIGVQDPAGNQYLHTLNVTQGSYVTSGDYQRAYTVDGKSYHHIIDPETLMPSSHWRSVTVICDDSGLADALSTALFVLPLEEGRKLLEECGATAMWVDGTGKLFYSPGFETNIRS